MTADRMLKLATKKLNDAGIENAAFDAACIVEHITGLTRVRVLLSDEDIPSEQSEAVDNALLRRISGEPLQYILGEWDFYGRTFVVGDGVLVPRPETELLVDLALEKIKDVENPVIFDLCAGSGCIGLTIAAQRPDSKVFLFEKYEQAYSYLERNIEKLALSNAVPVRCDIKDGRLEFILENPDFIISNPPYLRRDELSAVSEEVSREPVTALDGGEDGEDFYRVIAELWLPRIKHDGGIAVECDPSQTLSIAKMFTDHASRVKIVTDLFGCQRAVYADTY